MKVIVNKMSKEDYSKALKIYGSKISDKVNYESVKEDVFKELSQLKPLPVMDYRSKLSNKVLDANTISNSANSVSFNVINLSEMFKEEALDKLYASIRGSYEEDIEEKTSSDSHVDYGLTENGVSATCTLESFEDVASSIEDSLSSGVSNTQETGVKDDKEYGTDAIKVDKEEIINKLDFVEFDDLEKEIDDEDDFDEDDFDEDDFDEDDFEEEFDDDFDEDEFEEDEFEEEGEFEEEDLDDDDDFEEEFDEEFEEEEFEQDLEEDDFEEDDFEEDDFEEDDFEEDDNFDEDEFEEDFEDDDFENLEVEGLDGSSENISEVMGVQEDIVNNEDRARINIKNRTDTQRVKVESLSFDQLNSSEGDDLDFIKGLMDSPKITETPNKSDSSVPKKKGKDIDEENLPPNPVEFLRQYPRSLESLVKQYYPPKEVDKYVNRGLIQRSRGKLYI